ncbi:MAG: hypothetical protein GF330_07555, partial [Candidatus Eisenbacteria bacterium]|nr:hypothetical protein [Candidatus Eisenbacteria bacterium]
MRPSAAGLVTVALLLTVPAGGQPLPHLWSAAYGDSEMDTGFGVSADAQGNLILVGSFAGTIDFGGGPLVSAGDRDAYIAKFSPDGGHLWSARFGSLRSQHASGVATDSDGNIFVIGRFLETIDLGAGPLTSAGGWDIFVAKFTPDGTCLWSRGFGDHADQWGEAIGIGATGDAILCGYFAGAVDFGGGPLPSHGGDDIFLTRLSGTVGGHLWSQRFGEDRDQRARGLDVTRYDRIALAATIEGAVDFGGGLLGAFGEDPAVAVFDEAGAHVWSQCWNSNGSQRALEVALGDAGELYVTGDFEGAVDFGGGGIPSAGATDIYLASFWPNGGHHWSRGFGDPSHETVVGLDLTADCRRLSLGGSAAGTIDFGGGALVSAGGQDVFLATFDAGDGGHRTSALFGDDSEELAGFVAIGPSDRTYLSGHFRGSIDFGGATLHSAGDWDAFLAVFDDGAGQ